MDDVMSKHSDMVQLMDRISMLETKIDSLISLVGADADRLVECFRESAEVIPLRPVLLADAGHYSRAGID